MPRKAKNRVFKGTPSWAMPKVKRNGSVDGTRHTTGSSSATYRPKLQVQHVTAEMCIAEVHQRIGSKNSVSKSFQESQKSETVDSDLGLSVKGTASGIMFKPYHKQLRNLSNPVDSNDTTSRPIKHNISTNSTNISANTVSVKGDKLPSGYRLIDLLGLEAAVNDLHKCQTGTLKLKEDEKSTDGSSNLLFFECSICLKRTYLQESNHNHSSTHRKEAIQQMLTSGSIKGDDNKRKRLADENKSERVSRKSKLGLK